MQNVLFKTREPATTEGMVEFYAVSLTLHDFTGQLTLVQEIHGWWNPHAGKVTVDQGLRPEPETFPSFSEAVDRYCALRIHRAMTGFVHSFTWHCFSGVPTNYKRIEIPEDKRFRSSRGGGDGDEFKRSGR